VSARVADNQHIHYDIRSGSSPVIAIDDDDHRALAPGRPGLDPGTALCLSGGGYRAMLFHLGALWRLNELGQLATLRRVSSVSGGSITAGMLGLAWPHLAFDSATGVARAFVERVVAPIRDLASHTIDIWSVLAGLMPGTSASERIAAHYRDTLYGNATLDELPTADDCPRFIINAANVQSGALWRFTSRYAADWRVGMYVRPERIALATAVAASSAFPPVLSPTVLELDPGDYRTVAGNTLVGDDYRRRVVLSDGGVYDNLGLETAYKRCETILVSDAGAMLDVETRPHRDWPRHAFRTLELIQNQVVSLRKRQLIDAYDAKQRRGAYWGIRSDLASFELKCPGLVTMPFDHDTAQDLAATATRLATLDAARQDGLVNWGYVVCDAAMRAHVVPAARGVPPARMPY
jgi:NTE family protein